MNDPHVEALIYRLKHPELVSYANAEPIEWETAEFKVCLEAGQARVELAAHYTTAEDAQAVVEPHFRAWELAAGLEYAPGDIEFTFERSEIVDRNPTPGAVGRVATFSVGVAIDAVLAVERGRYPAPPQNMAVNADVEVMYNRYSLYKHGRDTLAAMAYFCYTVLKPTKGGREQTATTYGISVPVLTKLLHLASEKGGQEARKAKGVANEFTDAEREWVEAAVKVLIRRAAEVAYDPSAQGSQITMTDLPPLK